MPPETNGWNEWSNFVLKSLEDQNNGIKGIAKDISDIKTEIALLEFKSGVWGAIAGMIPVAITLIILFLSKAI